SSKTSFILTNLRAVPHLFVPKTVSGTIEPENVQAVRLGAAGTPGDHDAIAGPEGLGRDAHLHQLAAVVHLEPPSLGGAAAAASLDVDQQEGMRIDQLKLGHDTVDGDAAVAVVNT